MNDIHKGEYNSSLLSPINRPKVTDLVVEKILELIENNTLLPGDKLPSQRELERLLNVSRSTLREALSGLIMTGYIESRVGSGFYVKEREPEYGVDGVSGEDRDELVHSLYEARIYIEPILTGLAAKRATDEEIASLYKIVADIEEALPSEEAMLIGLQLHQRIGEVAGNPFLADVEKKLLNEFSRFILHVFDDPVLSDKELNLHMEIVKAIESHDVQKARQIAFDHINSFAEDHGIELAGF